MTSIKKICLTVYGVLFVVMPVMADESNETRLQNELTELKKKYSEQSLRLLRLEARLDRIESSSRQVSGTSRQGRFVKTVQQDNQPPAARQVAQAPQTQDNPQSGEEGVVKEAPASQSRRNVYQEQHTLFDRKFTLEPGFTYSSFDRNQLVLNGFLALDAIFLGNISVDDVEAQILTLDLTGRYGFTDRSQFDFNIPVLYRDTNYQSGGAGGASPVLIEDDVTLDGELGDISVGYYYQLWKETSTRPDVVWNIRAKAPTGTDPYGIETVDVDGSGNLIIPEELPSGNGVWALSTGLSFARTVDPAILFANVSYTHNFEEDFSDISSTPGRQPGEVDLGDSFAYGFGIAFALNERTSMSFGYSQRFTEKSKQKLDSGGGTQSIIGTDANVAQLSIGATYALSDTSSWVTNVGIGLNSDAPDVTFSMKFPFTF